MHYIIDAREAFAKQKTGKGAWTLGFLRECVRQGNTVTALTTASQQVLPDVECNVVTLPSGILFHLQATFFAVRHSKAIYISPISYITPTLCCLFPWIDVYTIVHDLIAFLPGKHDKKARFVEHLLLRICLFRSNRIGCVSEHTKQSLLNKYKFLHKRDVRTCYAGPNIQLLDTAQQNESYLLCVATLNPRKNQYRLLKAYAQLPDNLKQKFPLKLAGGKGWNYENILEELQKEPNASYLGYVDASQYHSLLANAYALVFPSEYEGFGMPVLDALLLSKPVLTSEGSSLAEVAGCAAILVDPYSITSIYAGLLELLTNTERVNAITALAAKQANQFTWERTCTTLLRND